MNTEGKINVDKLTPHPKNNYYFDDMSGDAWDALIQSISTSGVTNAITITDKNVIISGHQRVRACKVLGISEVSYKMIHYDNENDAMKDLIESNLRQRVLGNPNPVKMGRCFDFLQKYYGIQHGNNQYDRSPKVSDSSTQEQLADTYSISVDTINNYVKLAKAIPEIGDFVENGVFSKSTALSVIKLLSSDEQDELVSQLDATKRYTQKEVQEYVRQIKELKDNQAGLIQKLNKAKTLEMEISKLKQELENRPEKTIEVPPADYTTIKQRIIEYKKDNKRLEEQFSAKVSELQKLREQIKEINAPKEQFNQKIKDGTIFFCAEVAEFIKKVGGYVWLLDYINEMPEYERKSYLKAVENISAWADNLKSNINN